MRLTDAQKRAAAQREEKLQGRIDAAHEGLRGVLQKNPRYGGTSIDHSGSGASQPLNLSLDDSIDSIIGKLDHDLKDLAKGEWNGLNVKEEHIMDRHKISLQKLLTLTEALAGASSVKGWSSDFDLGNDSSSVFGQYDFDLFQADEKIKAAYGRWEDSVFKHVPREQIVLPRAINEIEFNQTRGGSTGLHQSTGLLNPFSGGKARSFEKPQAASLDIALNPTTPSPKAPAL